MSDRPSPAHIRHQQHQLAMRAARDQLEQRAHNRTPPGLPLDEWNKIQNAAKRERRRRKGKR